MDAVSFVKKMNEIEKTIKEVNQVHKITIDKLIKKKQETQNRLSSEINVITLTHEFLIEMGLISPFPRAKQISVEYQEALTKYNAYQSKLAKMGVRLSESEILKNSRLRNDVSNLKKALVKELFDKETFYFVINEYTIALNQFLFDE